MSVFRGQISWPFALSIFFLLQLLQIWSSYCFHRDTDQLWTHVHKAATRQSVSNGFYWQSKIRPPFAHLLALSLVHCYSVNGWFFIFMFEKPSIVVLFLPTVGYCRHRNKAPFVKNTEVVKVFHVTVTIIPWVGQKISTHASPQPPPPPPPPPPSLPLPPNTHTHTKTHTHKKSLHIYALIWSQIHCLDLHSCMQISLCFEICSEE